MISRISVECGPESRTEGRAGSIKASSGIKPPEMAGEETGVLLCARSLSRGTALPPSEKGQNCTLPASDPPSASLPKAALLRPRFYSLFFESKLFNEVQHTC